MKKAKKKLEIPAATLWYATDYKKFRKLVEDTRKYAKNIMKEILNNKT